MLKIFLFSSLLVLLFCSACNNPNDFVLPTSGKIREMTRVDSIPPVVLLPDEAVPFFLVDFEYCGIPMITDVEYLALDDNIGFISRVKEILFIEDRIIVLDALGSESSVFIFDTLGVGIKRLASGGRGPEEFFVAWDIYLIPGTAYFAVPDLQSPRIQVFDLNGNHVRTKLTGMHVQDHQPLNDSVTFYTSSFNQNFHIPELFNYGIFTGVGDSILFRGLPFMPHQKSSWQVNFPILNYRGDLQIRQHANNVIYQIINDSTYFVKYKVKFENSIQSKLERHPPGSDFGQLFSKYKGKGYSFMEFFLENDNSIFYVVTEGERNVIAYLYDKANNRSYQRWDVAFQYPRVTIDIGTIPVAIHENRFVAAIPGHIIYAHNYSINTVTDDQGNIIKEALAGFGCPRLEQIVRNSTENSNPVLKFFRYEFN